jgi:hypothetical protein
MTGYALTQALCLDSTDQSEEVSNGPAKTHTESLGTLSTGDGLAECDTNLGRIAIS